MAEKRSFKFRSRPEAVSAARRALDGFDSLLDAAVFFDASLCVSELVTNAVLHSQSTAEAELRLAVDIDDAGCLRVVVTDSGSGFERPQPDASDESGWGLFIVDRLAHRWGVDRAADGTSVWFEMGAREAARKGEPRETASAGGARDTSSARAPERRRRRGPVARLRVGAEA